MISLLPNCPDETEGHFFPQIFNLFPYRATRPLQKKVLNREGANPKQAWDIDEALPKTPNRGAVNQEMMVQIFLGFFAQRASASQLETPLLEVLYSEDFLPLNFPHKKKKNSLLGAPNCSITISKGLSYQKHLPKE